MDVDLAAYARITAEIAEGDRPTAAVLAGHGLDERTWNEATARWLPRLGEDALEHGADATLPLAYADAFTAAQDALKPVVPMTAEEYARLVVEAQRQGGPARPLAARNLSLADYLRLSRHWSRTLAKDPEQNDRFVAAYTALHAPTAK